MRTHHKTLKWVGFLGEIMEKTFNVWLILEETTENELGTDVSQIETYQIAVAKTEKLGQAVFEEAQEILHDLIN